MPGPARHMSNVGDALSIRYNNLVYELQAEGADVIVLSLGEAFFDLPLHSFQELPNPALFHYTHSRGITELREHLAGYYRDEYGVPVDPGTEIITTAGSKIAIHMSLMAILDPGDEVIIYEPAWVSYIEQVRLCHGVPVCVPYTASLADLGLYVTPRTKAIILNFPNNPRGMTVSRSEWDALHDLARREDLYILCDEAYSDFIPTEETFVSGAAGDPDKTHTIVCNSMSKNYGMSGWRLGYVISNPDLISEILKVNQHLVTCPAAVVSFYLAKHFHDLLAVTKPQIQAVVEKRAEVMRQLDALGLDYLPGTGTFYLFVSLRPSTLGSEEFCTRLLREKHVSAVPGIGYGDSCDGFIRVSVGTESMERTMRGIEAIADLVAQTASPASAASAASAART